MGSGGTLAYWNDNATINGQNSITAGNLKLTSTGSPVWKIKHTTGTETVVSDISALRIAPGDTLSYSFPAKITAQGQNIRFSVALAGGAITAPTTPTAADTALAAKLTSSTSFAVTGATAVAGKTNTFDYNLNTSTDYTTTITASIVWPFGTAGGDNTAALGKVNLANFTLTVNQVDGSV